MNKIKMGLCSKEEGANFLFKIGKKLNKEAFRRYSAIYNSAEKMFKNSPKITYFFIKEKNMVNEEFLINTYGDSLSFIYDFREFGEINALGYALRKIRGENALIYIIREDCVVASWHEGGFYIFNSGCNDAQLPKNQGDIVKGG